MTKIKINLSKTEESFNRLQSKLTKAQALKIFGFAGLESASLARFGTIAQSAVIGAISAQNTAIQALLRGAVKKQEEQIREEQRQARIAELRSLLETEEEYLAYIHRFWFNG